MKYLHLHVTYRFCKKCGLKQRRMKNRTNVYYELEKLGRREQRGIGSLTMKASVVCDAAPYNLVGRPR